MYGEIGKDFEKQHGDAPPQRRAPLWGKAIKTLLMEKSTANEPITVSWLAQKTKINEKNLHHHRSCCFSWNPFEAGTKTLCRTQPAFYSTRESLMVFEAITRH